MAKRSGLLGRWTLVTGLLLGSAAAAQGTVAPELRNYLEQRQLRFQPYEPNYGIWQYTENDDDALEARYSFKYLFSRPDCKTRRLFTPTDDSTEQCIRNYWSRWESFLSFTGEFDFYFGTRFSGPVINRVSNPAFHVRRYLNQHGVFDWLSLKYVDFGLQHFSNGQTTDASQIRDGQPRAQFFFDQDPFSPFFDTISREVNYASLEISGRFGSGQGQYDPVTSRCAGGDACYDFWVRAIPWYIDDDNPVTWGSPTSPRPSNVADYDRLRFVISRKRTYFSSDAQRGFGIRESDLSVKWRLGDKGLATDSLEISLFLPISLRRGISIPLYLQYHKGPMNNLSNYSAEQDSFGIGLRFY